MIFSSSGVEGTNFCTRRLPSHAYLDRNLGHATGLDTCCMGLWSCHAPEVPHMPLTWQHNHLNSGHWPLWSCQCLETFNHCLSATSHPDKDRLQRVFSQYGSKCFTVHQNNERYGTSQIMRSLITFRISAVKNMIFGSISARKETRPPVWKLKNITDSCS